MSRNVQLIDQSLLDGVVERALSSPRLRQNHNFHRSLEDNPHRFLNAFARGTYCAPHRHSDPPKSESFVALRGQVVFFLFDDAGGIVEANVLGDGGVIGIDIEPGLWHTVAALSDTAVCFEVKPGPWQPSTDKEFAPWAPREGDPGAAEYLERLLQSLT